MDNAGKPVWTFDKLTVSKWEAIRDRVAATLLR